MIDFNEEARRLEKDIELQQASFERFFGIKILMAFKCIKCGFVFDTARDAALHSTICKIPKDDVAVLNDFELEKLERLKEATKVVPADELVKMIANGVSLTPEMRERIVDTLEKTGEQVGNFALERAFLEGILTEEEWQQIHSERGLSIADMGSILLSVFEKKNRPGDEVGLVTAHGSPIYRNKDFILERFRVMVLDPGEAVDLFDKEDKHGFGRKQ